MMVLMALGKVALDLLEPHVDTDTARSEAVGGVPVVSYFGVYDGHGGSDCAEILKRKLHTICAREIFANRESGESGMKENMVNAYEAAEVELCSDKEAGACSVSTILRGRKLYTAACGDSRRDASIGVACASIASCWTLLPLGAPPC